MISGGQLPLFSVNNKTSQYNPDFKRYQLRGVQSFSNILKMQSPSMKISHIYYKWIERLPPVFLPGESQGQGSLLCCRLWDRTESDTTKAT